MDVCAEHSSNIVRTYKACTSRLCNLSTQGHWILTGVAFVGSAQKLQLLLDCLAGPFGAHACAPQGVLILRKSLICGFLCRAVSPSVYTRLPCIGDPLPVPTALSFSLPALSVYPSCLSI
jgi:hypothetical protein